MLPPEGSHVCKVQFEITTIHAEVRFLPRQFEPHSCNLIKILIQLLVNHNFQKKSICKVEKFQQNWFKTNSVTA